MEFFFVFSDSSSKIRDWDCESAPSICPSNSTKRKDDNQGQETIMDDPRNFRNFPPPPSPDYDPAVDAESEQLLEYI